MNATLWQRKLAAFLHDPPTKPLDLAEHVRHEDACDPFLRAAGFPDPAYAKKLLPKNFDWTAAAADRFPFPRWEAFKSTTGETSKFAGDAATPFRHPLGGSDFAFFNHLTADLAADEFQTIQKGVVEAVKQMPESDREWANFFLHWRRWPVESAQKDKRTYFLPADTRIPDHNIWIHNSIASALTTSMDDVGNIKTAFLIFQLGPVQEFIAQARSTRDLWSGSYLLSWLTAHAIKAVTDEIGPDCVIFPSLRGQPIFDLLHRDQLFAKAFYQNADGTKDSLWERMKPHPKDICTPNLPNRFFAVVPVHTAEELAKAAEQAVHDELKKITTATWDWFAEQGHPMDEQWRTRFDAQITAFPQITWQVCPWPDASVEELVAQFEKMAPVDGAHLRDLHKLATETIKPDHRDERYFLDKNDRKKLNNSGFAWPYFYALTDRLLAARRNTRDFQQTPLDDQPLRGATKDALSGKDESIGDEVWWGNIATTKNESIRRFFKTTNRLGTVNLIKKVWHVAYLEQEWQLKVRKTVGFESVSDVAGAQWKREISALLRQDADFCCRFLAARDTLCDNAVKCGLLEASDKANYCGNERGILLDAQIFYPGTWEKELKDFPAAQDCIRALAALYKKQKDGISAPRPPTYFAVLALDGDEMGQWISGGKTPDFKDQISNATQEYFKANGIDLKGIKRPLSPAYHAQFSEALSNCALYLARPIVEAFDGQLIYAGGDDVLAMLPAINALDCAESLRQAFKGQDFPEHLKNKQPFSTHGDKGGFVGLKTPKGEQPKWPLIVPGPSADVSVGIAIGHIKAPLQGMVRAAQLAEKRAKNKYNRSAFAVSLFKRSGEILEWGAKWDSGALSLYREFVRLSNEPSDVPVLSNRFGYALSGRLATYVSGSDIVKDTPAFQLSEIINKEFDFVFRQQSRKLDEKNETDRAYIKAKKEFWNAATGDEADSFLASLLAQSKDGPTRIRDVINNFTMLFKVANFIHRGDE